MLYETVNDLNVQKKKASYSIFLQMALLAQLRFLLKLLRFIHDSNSFIQRTIDKGVDKIEVCKTNK